jgi:putative spermidine/putrescine transport system substrate-binding protein
MSAGVIGAMLLVGACGAPSTDSSQEEPTGAVPDAPSEPVTLNILDVAGNLQLTQGMIDSFVEENPDVVSDVTFETSPSPEMAGKVKAQQDAGRVNIDLVLTGNDGLAAGVEQDLFIEVLPEFADRLTGMDNYLEPAAAMQELAQGYGVVVTYYPSGPLIEYDPARVPDPPTSAEELLEYARQNPGTVQYARPANSGPGRTLLMGLPYILGDSDPKDPVNGWDKTWAYLAELDQYVEYYPTGTTATMTNLANGSAQIIASTTGWDINPRALGTVPAGFEVGALDGFTWVTDSHYAVIPKGVSEDKQSAVLALIEWMLTPEQQAKAYDAGYFYPGPAIEGVTVDMAPEESQQVIEEFGREEYAALIEDNPKVTPLDAAALVTAFDTWDREIGGDKVLEE